MPGPQGLKEHQRSEARERNRNVSKRPAWSELRGETREHGVQGPGGEGGKEEVVGHKCHSHSEAR